MKIFLSRTVKEIQLHCCCDSDLNFIKLSGNFEKHFYVLIFLLRENLIEKNHH